MSTGTAIVVTIITVITIVHCPAPLSGLKPSFCGFCPFKQEAEVRGQPEVSLWPWTLRQASGVEGFSIIGWAPGISHCLVQAHDVGTQHAASVLRTDVGW